MPRPPLNRADHRGGKHHLLSVLKAATPLPLVPLQLNPRKIILYRSHEYPRAAMRGGCRGESFSATKAAAY